MAKYFSLIYSIIDVMHKTFYASVFLYHPPSQQILLQKNSSISTMSSPWLLFGGVYLEKEEPEALLKNIIFKLLNIKIKVVHLVYSYFNENTDKFQYVVYSKLRKFQNFSSKNGLTFAWFSFKDALKLQITEQTKHDILVVQRVIDAATRKRLDQHTFQ